MDAAAEGLLRDFRENPGDDTLRLILADRLEELGDPRHAPLHFQEPGSTASVAPAETQHDPTMNVVGPVGMITVPATVFVSGWSVRAIPPVTDALLTMSLRLPASGTTVWQTAVSQRLADVHEHSFSESPFFFDNGLTLGVEGDGGLSFRAPLYRRDLGTETARLGFFLTAQVFGTAAAYWRHVLPTLFPEPSRTPLRASTPRPRGTPRRRRA